MAKKSDNNQNLIDKIKSSLDFSTPNIQVNEFNPVIDLVQEEQKLNEGTHNNIHNYLNIEDIVSKDNQIFDEWKKTFETRKELASQFSKLSKEELKSAVQNYTDEELMRIYYASEAFQDRVYRMHGYKQGDNISQDTFKQIDYTIRVGVIEGLKGKVIYGNLGEGESQHTFRCSYISSGDVAREEKLGNVVGHEMSHGIYNSKAVAPGYNTYYNKNRTENNKYGKADATINLLGIHGYDGTHDSAGIEEAADTSGLRIQLTREGLYNMFNSSPMTVEEYKKVAELHWKNRLIQRIGPEQNKGARIIGDIAIVDTNYNINDLRNATKNVLTSLLDEPSLPEKQENIAVTLATANFQLETSEEQFRSKGLTV